MPPLLRLLPAFRQHVGWLGLGGAATGVASLLSLAAPNALAAAIDVDLAAGDREGLLRRVLTYAALTAGVLAASWAGRVSLEVAAQRAMTSIKRQLFERLLHHDLAYHDRTPSGASIGRVQGDVEALRVLFVEVLLALPADLVLVGGVIAVMLWRAPAIAGPLLWTVPTYLILLAVFRRVAAGPFAAQRAAVSAMTATLADTVHAMPSLAAFGRAGWAVARADEAVEHAAHTEFRSQLQPVWYFNAALGIRAIATTAVLMGGASQVAAGEATVGVVLVALAYLRQLFTPLMRMSQQLATLERARASASRVVDLLDARPTIADSDSPQPWPSGGGAVRFEGVGFQYPGSPPVLTDLDLELPAGATVGLVGPTGSGKSTLVDVLLRFRDPTAGRVTIDGVDLRAIALRELRAKTALVLQDVRLLRGTVLDNLGGDPVAAARALAEVGLDWPLDAAVDDERLSRGERQLLTFARALVADPALLVLDEATSAIDPRAEAAVEAALERVMAGRTVLIVAHRLTTVRRCTKVVVLNGGRVVESGDHPTLMAAGGAYAAWVALQEAA